MIRTMLPSALTACVALLTFGAGCSGKGTDTASDSASDSVSNDADGDGYTSIASGGTDCDDTDPNVNPGEAETYYDGIDNDCNPATADTDQDADGYTVDVDCNDTDPTINPSAAEICDGVDNNCDGYVDEGVTIDGWSDLDGDGYGDPLSPVSTCDPNNTTVVQNDGDCDDSNPDVHPGATETCTDTIDKNCDGSVGTVDADGDGYPACEECDDSDPAIHPGATEVCDGKDNDCDGTVDVNAVDATVWYLDADGDGYGDDATSVTACSQPDGYVPVGGDCNDADTAYNPGAAEDCSSTVDYNCDGSVGYADADGDGYPACEDCDDSNASVHPGGVEVCDGLDNDCNGTVDDNPTDPTTFYADADSDGYGDAATTEAACTIPAGYVTNSTDCDDANLGINPGVQDICDGVDNNCDGVIDGDATYYSTFYADIDGDGYGDGSASETQCQADAGYVDNGSDCNDSDVTINPDAIEVCDGVDNDCDGTVDIGAVDAGSWYTDADSDGYGTGAAQVVCDQPAGTTDVDGDCDDTNAAVNPAAVEVCDGVDNDCNGSIDDGATDATTYYADVDGDGFGDASETMAACGGAPAGYVSDATDCDDTRATVFPGAPESCNGIDDNCNGTVDESGSSGETSWYADADGDGYGDETDTVSACSAPSGYIADATDCDDTNAAVHPGAAEVDNGVDDDCDLWVDEDFVSAGDLVIDEIDRQPYVGGSSTNSDGMWFEVYNASARTINLSDWYIIRADATTNDAYFIDPADDVTVAPGAYLVLCKTSTYEGKSGTSYPLACDYIWGDATQAATYEGTYHDNTFNFQRDSDSVSLYIEGGSSKGRKIDGITWYYDTSGATTANNWPRDGGRSMALDPDSLDAVSNDSHGNWCSTSNTSTYSWYKSGSVTDYGTPGAKNYNCF